MAQRTSGHGPRDFEQLFLEADRARQELEQRLLELKRAREAAEQQAFEARRAREQQNNKPLTRDAPSKNQTEPSKNQNEPDKNQNEPNKKQHYLSFYAAVMRSPNLSRSKRKRVQQQKAIQRTRTIESTLNASFHGTN
jgi:hypothetical protein